MKLEVTPSDLVLIGVYIFDSSIFRAVSQIKPSSRNELEIATAIQYLVDHGYYVDSHVIDGWWKDTGKPENVLEANRMMLECLTMDMCGVVDELSVISGRVSIAKGARVINNAIRGSVIVATGTIIDDS